MKRYEYQAIYLPNDGRSAEHLNSYGLDGWAVASFQFNSWLNKHHVLLMRELDPEVALERIMDQLEQAVATSEG